MKATIPSPLLLSRIAGLIAAISALALILPGCREPAKPSGRRHQTNDLAFVPIGSLKDERSFQDYVVRVYEEAEPLCNGSFEILKSGRRVYAQEGGCFRVGGLHEDKELKEMEEEGIVGIPLQDDLLRMGRDITGDGQPDLVISEFTGGAHCCFRFHLFGIGKEFRQIGTIDARHSGTAYFADLDGDASLEVVLHDWTFAYWRVSFAESPAPKVILRLRAPTYRLAGDLMRQPAPTHTELEARAQEVREQWKAGDPPGDLWDSMLNLIYTGHADLAWRFLDRAWPPDRPGKDEFLRDFRSQLSKSPYWGELQAWSAD